MTPVSPVIPNRDLPEIVFAKDHPEYKPLPAYKIDGHVLTRWHGSWTDRLRFLLTGSMWLWIITNDQLLQPVLLTTETPV